AFPSWRIACRERSPGVSFIEDRLLGTPPARFPPGGSPAGNAPGAFPSGRIACRERSRRVSLREDRLPGTLPARFLREDRLPGALPEHFPPADGHEGTVGSSGRS